MKSKRKLDKKAIQQFFIDHTEKIVIGAVGLVFLYFAYSAVMLQVNDSYKKAPKDLEDAVAKAQATITDRPQEHKPADETPIRPMPTRSRSSKQPLDPNKYPV